MEETPLLTQKKQLTSLLAFVGFALSITHPAQAQDGNALVKKMVQTYKAYNTFSETSEAKIVMLGAPSQIQSTTFKFQKPSKFFVQTSDPQSGTLSIYSDGTQVTIFGGRQNIFTRRDYAGSFVSTVRTYEKVAKEMLDMNITQILSPISFMTAGENGLREAKSFKFLGTKAVNGRTTNMVLSPVDLEWLTSIVGRQNFLPDKCQVKLYIDKETNLLIHSVIQFLWQSKVQRPGVKDKIVIQGMVLDERHRNQVMDKPIDANVFRFAPQPGSKEVFRETR
jgi:hypothetical protein